MPPRSRASRMLLFATLSCVAILAAACGGRGDTGDSSEPDGAATVSEQRYPEVVDAELESSGGGEYALSVTISSPYDSPRRYADGWRVLSPDGEVLGRHELMHDHADEQPFTRTQTGLEIPEGVGRITVEGRDLENGYGGQTVTVPVSG